MNSQEDNLSQFVNPKASLTPAGAGSTVMLISNTIWKVFGLSQPLVGLSLSFLFALLMVAKTPMKLWERAVYCILNCLVIFSFAISVTAMGNAAIKQSNENPKSALLDGLIFSVASAQTEPSNRTSRETSQEGWCCINNEIGQSTLEACNQWGGQFFNTPEEAEQHCPPTPSQEPERPFFKPWF